VVPPTRAVLETASTVSVEAGTVAASSALRTQDSTSEEMRMKNRRLDDWRATRA